MFWYKLFYGIKYNIEKKNRAVLTVPLYSSVNVSRSLKFFKETKAEVLASAYIKIATVTEDNLNLEMSQNEFFDYATGSHAAMVQK